VFYAPYPPSLNPDSRVYLAHPEKREFRGHATVTEQHYDGATTSAALLQTIQHWFYQGDAGCALASMLLTSGSTQYVNENNSCYQTMVQREGWKGQEYQTEVRANGSTLLQRTSHSFTRVNLPFYGSDATTAGPSNNYKRAGLWRAFNPEIQTLTQTYEGGGTPVEQKTTYAYDQSGYQPGGPFGNLTSQAEYNGMTLVRTTEHFYDTLVNGTSYIVDRPWADDTRDSANRLLSLTHYFYDGLNTSVNTVAAKGDLTRVARYYDVPLAASAQNSTLHGQTRPSHTIATATA
jgi:hypothetical protein